MAARERIDTGNEEVAVQTILLGILLDRFGREREVEHRIEGDGGVYWLPVPARVEGAGRG